MSQSKVSEFAMASAFLLAGVLSARSASAAILAANTITGTNPNTASPYTANQTVLANVTFSGISRGTGIAGNAANDRYNANGWNSPSLDANDYFSFTLTPSAGFEIDFTSFVYTGQASGSGPTSVAFRASDSSFATNIGTPSIAGTTISLTSIQNRTTATEFRFYGWGASASTGTFSINDFTFNGTVSSVAPVNVAPAFSNEPYNVLVDLASNNSFSFATSATDGNNDALTYSIVSGLPAFASFSSAGVLSGSGLTSSAIGTYAVAIQVSDGNGGIDTSTINLTVVPEPTSIGLLAIAGLAAMRRRRA